jgi:hypothetical protein
MGKGYKAIPEAVLAGRAAAVAADVELLSDFSERSLDDPVTRPALLSYILLDQRPELVADLGLSADDLFWNKYYWFQRLKRLHELIEHGGKECGPMAQEAFDMLPDGGNLDPYPDIETLARRDAQAQFRAAARPKTKKKPRTKKKKPR